MDQESQKKQLVSKAYVSGGGVVGASKILGVSYPTAYKWLKNFDIIEKKQGYNKPDLPVLGSQFRLARECLGFTRQAFCKKCGVSMTSIRRFELGQASLRIASFQKAMKVFLLYDVIFNDDKTVTIGQPKIQ